MINDISLFSGAEIKVIIHATEDESKVVDAISKNLEISSDKITLNKTEGHWGNIIIFVYITLDNKEANSLAFRIFKSLNTIEKYEIQEKIENYIDESGNLYLRLDKQRAIDNRISLSEKDSIRIKLKPKRRFKIDNYLKYYEVLFLLEE